MPDDRQPEYEVADACDMRLFIVPLAVVVLIVGALVLLIWL